MKVIVSKPLVVEVLEYRDYRKYENITDAVNELIRVGIEKYKDDKKLREMEVNKR